MAHPTSGRHDNRPLLPNDLGELTEGRLPEHSPANALSPGLCPRLKLLFPGGAERLIAPLLRSCRRNGQETHSAGSSLSNASAAGRCFSRHARGRVGDVICSTA
jgi:hypothetical protein